MFMRLVHRKIKPESLSAYRAMYEKKFIPALQQTLGCQYAGLIQSSRHADECISMTLWDEKENAETYEKSGVFAEILQDAAPYLADSSEWRVQLSDDLTVQYQPVPVEPVVQAYRVATIASSQNIPQNSSLYLRIVSPNVHPGKIEEFKQLYNVEILPALRTVKGCLFAFLTENIKEDQVISVTIWQSKQDADAYEQTGVFSQLVKKVEHTFSEVYQWKMQLEKESGGKAVTSGEMKVEGYSMVAGKSF
ncbi:antibiotic biosynthesis monooxygenase [bacterium]|nr:antibiotic biosynthesis monooxygenase [bacterium]